VPSGRVTAVPARAGAPTDRMPTRRRLMPAAICALMASPPMKSNFSCLRFPMVHFSDASMGVVLSFRSLPAGSQGAGIARLAYAETACWPVVLCARVPWYSCNTDAGRHEDGLVAHRTNTGLLQVEVNPWRPSQPCAHRHCSSAPLSLPEPRWRAQRARSHLHRCTCMQAERYCYSTMNNISLNSYI
jgi:hypothetical protein